MFLFCVSLGQQQGASNVTLKCFNFCGWVSPLFFVLFFLTRVQFFFFFRFFLSSFFFLCLCGTGCCNKLTENEEYENNKSLESAFSLDDEFGNRLQV